jgi:hypothetical protein
VSEFLPNYTSPYTSPLELIQQASNIIGGDNPVYGRDDFLKWYPQFTNSVPAFIMDQFVAMGNAVVKYNRWNAMWEHAIGLFVAHFATLYLQSMGDPSSSAAQVVSAATTRGLQTSKSIGDVSVSYDVGGLTRDLQGWASWTTTTFGTQYATLARMVTKGGMYVY